MTIEKRGEQYIGRTELPDFKPGIYHDLWRGVNTTELITPYSDPAVARLYDLASIPKTEADHNLYWFMRDFLETQDPVVRKLYGKMNRLAKIQYYMDKNAMEINGNNIPIVLGTWSADVRFASDEEVKRPEGVRKLNEDAILVRPFGRNQLVAAVFDGASSQKPVSGLEQRQLKGSWYVSHLAAMGFPFTPEYRELEANTDTTAKDFTVALNRWLKQELSKVPGVDYNDVLTVPGMAATIALIDYSKKHISIAHVADTVGIIEHMDHAETVTNNLNAPFDNATQELVKRLSTTLWKTPREIADLKHPLILQQLADSFRAKINTQNGTGILNGMPELENTAGLIQEINVDITNELLSLHLASDGWHMTWTGRERADVNEEARAVTTNKMASAMHSPYFRPSHPAYQSLERLSMDPEHWAIKRLAHDDASLLSVGLSGQTSEQDTQYRRNGRRLLQQDYEQILRSYEATHFPTYSSFLDD
jgi:hypothetical protein